MTTPTVILSDAELERLSPPEEDRGFGALVTPQGPLPLKALEVNARIEGLIAETHLTQAFVNNHREPLEATYIFPLPDRAAATRFRLEVAGRVVEGVLKERGQARREYDEAIQAGHRAAITEEERPGVFTMRVGNLPAGETATVRLTLAGPVLFDAGEVTYRFPLVVAPRYIPGKSLDGVPVGEGWAHDTDAVPDASRITPPVLLPGYPFPVRFAMTVDVFAADVAPSQVRSSLHAVTNEAVGESVRIEVRPGERLNRDFVLRYRLGESAVKSSLALVPDAEGNAGTFLLTLVPPAEGAGARLPKPRDVVFVLDRSGSMGGWKMLAARRALARLIDSLTERDRFTVFAFDDVLEVPPVCEQGLATASDRNRFRATEWLAGVDARGGTEMAGPLDRAVATLTAAERDRVLVLLTDGQVGNEDQILHVLGKRLKGIRIFTLGVDRAINEAFLKRFAALGGGSCDVVESEDRLDEVMAKVQRRVGPPLLAELGIEPDGVEIERDSLVPARMPDLFPGVPLIVSGRYHGGEGALRVKAVNDAGQPFAERVSGRVSRMPALAQVWARGRLRDLEDHWAIGEGGPPAELEQQIVALSLKFGVLCRFTAFVAVDLSEVVNAGGQQQRIVQPVEPAEGWDMLKAGAVPMLPMACSAATVRSAGVAKSMLAPMDADLEDEMRCSFEEAEDQGVAPTPPPPPSPGFFGRLQQAVLGAVFDRSPAESATETVELTAYRHRAADMLAEFRANPDQAHAFGVLTVKLEALVEDLKSIGAEVSDLHPLEALLKVLGQPHLSTAQLAATVEKTLAEFAAGR
jgi:Ca-activated chloride channel family protein